MLTSLLLLALLPAKSEGKAITVQWTEVADDFRIDPKPKAIPTSRVLEEPHPLRHEAYNISFTVKSSRHQQRWKKVLFNLDGTLDEAQLGSWDYALGRLQFTTDEEPELIFTGHINTRDFSNQGIIARGVISRPPDVSVGGI